MKDVITFTDLKAAADRVRKEASTYPDNGDSLARGLLCEVFADVGDPYKCVAVTNGVTIAVQLMLAGFDAEQIYALTQFAVNDLLEDYVRPNEESVKWARRIRAEEN